MESEGAGLPEGLAAGLEMEEPWMVFYLNAFLELSTCREAAGLPIPWTAIDLYAGRYGVAGPDYERFLGLIRAMDMHCIKGGGGGKP